VHFEELKLIIPAEFGSFFCDPAVSEGLGLWCLMPLSTIFQLYRKKMIEMENISKEETNTIKIGLKMKNSKFWILASF